MAIKNCTYYVLDEIINIKNLDLSNIKIQKKSYKNILIYYTGYVASNILKPLDLFINNDTRYLEENDGNNYLTLILTK